MSDPGKRDYLLPPGCKDLADALEKLKQQKKPEPIPHPPITRSVKLPGFVSVQYLTELIGEDPEAISQMKRRLGIYGEENRCISFAEARRLLLVYGIWARPEGDDRDYLDVQ